MSITEELPLLKHTYIHTYIHIETFPQSAAHPAASSLNAAPCSKHMLTGLKGSHMNTFQIVALTWKPKQMVGMTLNVEAQELILHTDRRRHKSHFLEFTNAKRIRRRYY